MALSWLFAQGTERHTTTVLASNGKVLWQTRLASAPNGFPVTYISGNKQYVAVPAGPGTLRGVTATLTPDIYSGNPGNALYVFELPN